MTTHDEMGAPFNMDAIQVRINYVSEAKQRASILFYADSRAYQERLDECFGWGGWSVELTPLSDKVVKCQLSIFPADDTDGQRWPLTIRESLGEDSDPMAAEARAFKRACTSLGIGRYLYQSPDLWVDVYKSGKNWYITDAGRAWALQQFASWCQYMYPDWHPGQQPAQEQEQPQPQQQQQQAPPPQPQQQQAPGPQDDQHRTPAYPPEWKLDQDAKDWAVREGYCANEFEAAGSFLKQLKLVVGEPRMMTPAERSQVFSNFYARQLEKGRKHAG
jgi:hypothetical protein